MLKKIKSAIHGKKKYIAAVAVVLAAIVAWSSSEIELGQLLQNIYEAVTGLF